MHSTLVTVEPVDGRAQLRRFRDVPYLLHGADERWRPGVRAYESWRLDARRHPYFERGDAAYFLARRLGQPVGRIVAHRRAEGAAEGAFGFFAAPDDDEVVVALLDAAQAWLADEGARSMTGPLSWDEHEEFGVMVGGHEHPTMTGRAWNPPWYPEVLVRAGLDRGDRRHTYRLATDRALAEPATLGSDERADDSPPHAGGYADPALVLPDVAAVPDVSAALADASVRSAWRVARDARSRRFDTAVCVRCDGEPSTLVPRMLEAARAAGYRWLVAPWGPAGAEPETTHQVFSRSW